MHRLELFADRITRALGSAPAVLSAFGLIIVWAITGPFLGFSEQWQLVINTLTTIITFTMVFIIQMSQNRDTRALHAKLDAIIHAIDGVDDQLMHLEDEPSDVIEERRP